MAIARSNPAPCLRSSAGDKLIVTLALGQVRPEFMIAVFDRCLDSMTEASGKPTSPTVGKPGE